MTVSNLKHFYSNSTVACMLTNTILLGPGVPPAAFMIPCCSRDRRSIDHINSTCFGMSTKWMHAFLNSKTEKHTWFKKVCWDVNFGSKMQLLGSCYLVVLIFHALLVEKGSSTQKLGGPHAFNVEDRWGSRCSRWSHPCEVLLEFISGTRNKQAHWILIVFFREKTVMRYKPPIWKFEWESQLGLWLNALLLNR